MSLLSSFFAIIGWIKQWSSTKPRRSAERVICSDFSKWLWSPCPLPFFTKQWLPARLCNSIPRRDWERRISTGNGGVRRSSWWKSQRYFRGYWFPFCSLQFWTSIDKASPGVCFAHLCNLSTDLRKSVDEDIIPDELKAAWTSMLKIMEDGIRRSLASKSELTTREITGDLCRLSAAAGIVSFFLVGSILLFLDWLFHSVLFCLPKTS